MIDIQINRFAVNINSGRRYRSLPRRLANRPEMVDFIIREVRTDFFEEIDRRCRIETWGLYDAATWFDVLLKSKHESRLQHLYCHLSDCMFHIADPSCREDEEQVCAQFAADVKQYIDCMKQLEPKKQPIRVAAPVQLSLF